jgi:glycosyltransferase involved in cell wall biosynthesis
MKKKLCIFLKSLPTGGVEKMMLNLAGGLADRGYQVEIVLFERTDSSVDSVPESVTLMGLTPGGTKRGGRKLFAVARAFREYVRKHRPDIVISAKEQANLVNVIFRLVYRSNYRSVITRHVPLDGGLVGTDAKPLVRWLYKRMLWRADGIVAVSEGIAGEIRTLFPARAWDKVSVISNPVIDDSIYEKSGQHIEEPWFKDRREPVIVASGRLSVQKGFDILLEAVSILMQKMHVRLLVLGEGAMHESLMDDITRLSLKNNVKLLGFKANPYPYYKNADLFVLSSRWEGQPLALIEALALGTRVVATDCRTGPNEILEGGRLGILVTPEDHTSLAEGIEAAFMKERNNSSDREHDIGKYRISEASKEYDELFCRLLDESN